MKIQVTEQNIREGKKGSRSCPIALALNEQLGPNYKFISVGAGSISFLKKKEEKDGMTFFTNHNIDLPEIAKDFIKIFDEYINVLRLSGDGLQKIVLEVKQLIKPFEFEIELDVL